MALEELFSVNSIETLHDQYLILPVYFILLMFLFITTLRLEVLFDNNSKIIQLPVITEQEYYTSGNNNCENALSEFFSTL